MASSSGCSVCVCGCHDRVARMTTHRVEVRKRRKVVNGNHGPN